MDKESLLQELAGKVASGEVTKEEVMSRIGVAQAVPTPAAPTTNSHEHHFSVTKMLYVLGAAVVLIGILIFVAQIWEDIGSVGRIAVTLGLGFVLAGAGSMLMQQKREDQIGAIFHFLGGMLIPGGALVTLSEFEVEVISLWPVTIVFGAIFAFYLLLTKIHKHPILTFFAIANGTTFVYLLVEALVPGRARTHEELYAYLTMAVGGSYLFLAHAFRQGWNSKLLGALYLFGSTGVLGGAFSQVFEYTVWEFLFFLLPLGGLYLSVFMKSRAVLVMSTLFLIAHLVYISEEYFADSLGWPIMLVVLGFVFIGLGYGSVTINNRFIKKSN